MKQLIINILRKFNYELKPINGLVINEKIYPDFSNTDLELANFVRPYTMTSPERMFALMRAVEYIEKYKIEGDVVECGVWRGGSSMIMAKKLLDSKNTNRQLYMYDTYDGMSEPTEEDKQHDGQVAQQMLDVSDKVDDQIWCFSALDEVKKNMKKTGFDISNIHFVQGKVEDTIPNVIPKKIAILRLDTDWYESTKHEMEHLFPLLVKGGVLIIDDYGHWQGARKAIDEYLETHNIQILLNRVDYTARIGVKL
jgi:O-methyltransferase